MSRIGINGLTQGSSVQVALAREKASLAKEYVSTLNPTKGKVSITIPEISATIFVSREKLETLGKDAVIENYLKKVSNSVTR